MGRRESHSLNCNNFYKKYLNLPHKTVESVDLDVGMSKTGELSKEKSKVSKHLRLKEYHMQGGN